MRKVCLPVWLVTAMVAWGAVIAGCGSSPSPKPHSHKPHVTAAAPVTVTGGLQSAGGSVHPPGWGLPPKGSKLRPQALPPSTLTGTAEQYDTTTTSTIPHGAHWLAGYTSGFWPTYHSLLGLPWHPRVVSIAINVSHHARCLDIEPGDADPSQAASWFFAVKSDPGMRGSLVDGKPCEYSSFWEFVNQVIPVLKAHGIKQSMIWEWDANYTFVRHLDRGFSCTQWTDKALGRNLDESTCTLNFLGYHPAPKPKPKPKPAPKPLTEWQKEWNAGYTRGYDVHWLRLHHRKVPPTHLKFTKVVQQGYNTGYNAVHH